jgi:methylenetetrahydrofolate--tRNA-(uracil-5-)-methyltransferase
VDRTIFAEKVTTAIKENPLINLINEEVTSIPDNTPVIIASGPLTSDSLAQKIKEFTGQEHLHFFDAIAPIIERDSIDFNKAFFADRYGKGENSYINCPMNREEYDIFYEKLINAELIELKEFEKGAKFFESCLPVEVLAGRGKDTLRFGPMKPVGLNHPVTGQKYYAVVQLRQDNKAETLYNMVGFQTNTKWGAQKEVIKSIPGLENAEIARFGVMHRNTFINSPFVLKPSLQTVRKPEIFFAGQITGVEGYTESIATGLLAGINAANMLMDRDLLVLESKSMLGALCNYITYPEHKHFQPVNSNWGILESIDTSLTGRKNKDLKKKLLSERSLSYLDSLIVV